MIVRNIFAGLATGCLMLAPAYAADDYDPTRVAFPIPDHYVHVNDYESVLRITTAIEITKKVEALERLNGTDIVFLSVPFVGKDGVDAYASKVVQKWWIGNNGQHNGILFLTSQDGTTIWTQTGIQGALPDVKISRIFREILEPYWKRGEFSEGAELAMDEMIKAAKGEDTAPTFYDYMRPVVPTKPENMLMGMLILFGIGYAILIFLNRRKTRKSRNG